jgi:hypothetical protein
MSSWRGALLSTGTLPLLLPNALINNRWERDVLAKYFMALDNMMMMH